MTTARALNAERQRQRMKWYQLGARVSLEPGRLSQMLRGRIPLPRPLAQRIAEELERAAGELERAETR